MAGDVGQAFLGDAVEDELDVAIELTELRVNPSVDGDARSPCERAREVVEGACESEVVERLGAQLLGDPANLFEVGADCFLCFLERASLCGRRISAELLQEEEDAGHRLADLVVEAAGDSLSLLFSGLQGTRAGLATLGLQAFEHAVERSLERADLAGAGRRDRPGGAQDVEFLHPVGEPLERRE